ncbi:MAG TPA: acetate/propionate family kinase [Firmicutes bacterium]|jgi:acetate kinase|nr:acetate/propionate family kinase [Bacillota bacterium]
MMILVANVGSTSLKYKLFDMGTERVLAVGKVERVGNPPSLFSHRAPGVNIQGKEVVVKDHTGAIKLMLDALVEPTGGVIRDLAEIAGVGFKTVHARGVSGSCLLTEGVIAAMEEYAAIAPAHNPPYLATIRIFQKLLPGKSLVGVFETAFHQTMPPEAYLYGVPYDWWERYGIRRYGFHGASHRYISERVRELFGPVRHVVSCHLGGSASLCAIKDGRSIDTSMGFSPQAGILHSNRCGDLDPFILYYLVEKGHYTWAGAKEALVTNGGLKGLSGVSGDVRDIEGAAARGERRAAAALDVYCYGIKKYIGAYAAILGGLDVVAFTGGIGENGVAIRERVLEGLEFLGIHIDGEKNQVRGREALISTPDSRVKVMVIPANEEIIVARETQKVLAAIGTGK